MAARQHGITLHGNEVATRIASIAGQIDMHAHCQLRIGIGYLRQEREFRSGYIPRGMRDILLHIAAQRLSGSVCAANILHIAIQRPCLEGWSASIKHDLDGQRDLRYGHRHQI